MDNGENSSDNTIRIGVENISDGDINIEVVDKVTPANGQDVLIGVDNHSVSGNNNIKVHDMDLKGCGNARIGAGNYAHGSNNIFIGSLDPTNGSCSNSEDPPCPPMPPIKPSGFGGPLLAPLPIERDDRGGSTPSLRRVPSGPLRSVESDDNGSGGSLPRRIRRSTTPQFAIGTMSTDRPNSARTAPQPLSRTKTMRGGPMQPQPPIGPLPPNPPFSA